MREIKFRGKRVDNGEWIYGDLVRIPKEAGDYSEPPSQELVTYITKSNSISKEWVEVNPETVGQLIGIENWKDIKVWEGDIIEFWLCYPTSQTHTGDNIPTGSYTEPDESQIVKVKANVFYDEEEGKFDWSILSPYPYGFSQYVSDYCFKWEPRVLIGLSSYDRSHIKHLLGCPENYTTEEYKEYSDLLFELTGMSEDEFMDVCNQFEIIGNIHETDLITDKTEA